jgi:hypothetical protein
MRPTMNPSAERRHVFWRIGPLLRPALVVLVCQSPLACYYHDDEGKEGPLPPAKSIVYVADYRVTDVASGVTYGSGCRATQYVDCVGCTIDVNVPYGVEYLLELTSFRYITADWSDVDASVFCEVAYESQAISHQNPTCYQTAPTYKNAELMVASVVNSAGVALTSSDTWVVGTNTDVEQFTIRSFSWGSVNVSLAGPPCNETSSNIVTLLNVPSP